jgi:YVTN family beta-propeller protein
MMNKVLGSPALLKRRLALSGLAWPVLSLWAATAQAQLAPAGAASGASPSPAPARNSPILVLNSQDANVSVIDPVTWKETQRVATGKEPHHLYMTPDDKSVIVANAASNSLTFLDPKTVQVQRTIRDIADPYHLRFSPDMKWFVTAANRLDHIDIYRWQPLAPMPLILAKRVSASKVPSHLAIDSKSTVVYCTLQDSDEVIAIDLVTQAVRWRFKLGRMPADIFLTRDDKTLLIGLTGDSVVEIVDVSGEKPQQVKRLTTDKGAHAFRARGDGRHLIVSNRVANHLSMIDLQTMSVVATLPGPGGPDCMEVMSDGKTLLLTSRWAGMLSVIDLDERKLLRQIKVGRSPHGVWTLDHAPRG